MQGNIWLVPAILAVALSACSDAVSPSKHVTAPVSGDPAQAKDRPAKGPSIRRVSPAEFHATNKQTWIGVAHNQAMDDLRAEIRRSRPKDVCRVIERIAVESRIPGAAAEAAHLMPTRKAAFDQVGCRGPRGGGRKSAVGAQPASIRAGGTGSGDFELSDEAWALVNEVIAVGDGVTNASDLASALSAITSAASGLTPDEASVVEAAASVSLSSYEYWTQNGQAMANEMAAAYGECIEGGGGDACYFATGRPIWNAPPRAIVQLAAYTAPRPCFIDTDTIWSGDKWGVGVGLTIGLMTKTVQGALIGLIGGAIGGSGAAAVWEYGKFLVCAFK